MKNINISDKLEIIKNAILDKIQAKYIYLFGSYAYGSPNKDSDIDIYVVIPDEFNEDIVFTMGKIVSYLRKQDVFKIDLFLVRESKFLDYKEYSSFEKTICEKGILVYE